MDWTEIPASEDIKNIGTRKQLFFDNSIIEERRWLTPDSSRCAALLVETPEETARLVEAEIQAGHDVSGGVPGHVLMGTQHIYRTQHVPVRHPENPIVKRDRPWEGINDQWQRIFSPNVMYDEEDQIWKMWYGSCGGLEAHKDLFPEGTGFATEPPPWGCYRLYATSQDGIHWEKPELGIIDFEGHTKTNIVFGEPGEKFYYLGGITKDPHDAKGKDWRYKGTVKTKPKMTTAVSPDGIHWRIDDSFDRIGDESSGAFYDPRRALYIQFTRNMYRQPVYIAPDNKDIKNKWALPHRTQRTIQIALSKDMVHWYYPQLIASPDEHDPLDGGISSIVPFCYEDLYLAILGIRTTGRLKGNMDDNQLAYSRDGLHWYRMGERKTFFPPGPKGSFDNRVVDEIKFLKHGDEIRFYYTGVSIHGKYSWEAIGLATMRLDGFVSFDAPPPDPHLPPKLLRPVLLTKPLWSNGNRLVINAEAKGYINAELTDPDGRVLKGFGHKECDAFTGDSLRHTFSWQGREDIGELFPLRIRFRMSDAQLYSLQMQKV